ncbi:MAG TPA: NAD(P)/FAD-dependent oxidoreductase [Candidatus Limnocylindrales bacterium]|nr:NAD(P)/FAD-dependent oxidoreductase [Candidatus Limnocylindrales bacterium]
MAPPPTVDDADVAIVGGGPAGCALAALLAGRGRSVVVLERRPVWRWHACGVFAGPAVRPYLRDLGLGDGAWADLARDVPAMRLETPAGTTLRLAYGADAGGPAALAFDRRALDEGLLAGAEAAGACVRRGERVTSVRLGARPVVAAGRPDGQAAVRARIVVGADGIRSTVARAVGVGRPPRFRRVGVTFHVPEARADAADASDAAEAPDAADAPVDARMIVGRDRYSGLAPVPGRRVNVGLVLRGSAAADLRANGGGDLWRETRAGLPPPVDGAVLFTPDAPLLDRPAGAAPIGHRVTRRAGPGWLLVGDAAGFVDPFTGEGIHRALASAFLAAEAIDRALAGDRRALDGYDRAMRARFAAKDGVSLLVQAFLARPALFEYAARRLERRRGLGRTFEAVLGDLAPASRALDPRFLVRLLAP